LGQLGWVRPLPLQPDRGNFPVWKSFKIQTILIQIQI
jgi:hypothetical protein